MSKARPTTPNDFPLEVLTEIFIHLRDLHGVWPMVPIYPWLSTMCVCRKWNDAISSPRLWNKINEYFTREEITIFLNKSLRAPLSIRWIVKCDESLETLRTILIQFQRIEHLRLELRSRSHEAQSWALLGDEFGKLLGQTPILKTLEVGKLEDEDSMDDTRTPPTIPTSLSVTLRRILGYCGLTSLVLSRPNSLSRVSWYSLLGAVQSMQSLKHLTLRQTLDTAIQPSPTPVAYIENPKLETVHIEDAYEPSLRLLTNIRFGRGLVPQVTFDCTGPELPATGESICGAFNAIYAAYIAAHGQETLPADLDMVVMKYREFQHDDEFQYGLRTALLGYDEKRLFEVFLPEDERHPGVPASDANDPEYREVQESLHHAPFVKTWLDSSRPQRYRQDFGFSTNVPFRKAFWKSTIRGSRVLDYLILEEDAIWSFFTYLTSWYAEYPRDNQVDESSTSSEKEQLQLKMGPLPLSVRKLQLQIGYSAPPSEDFEKLAWALEQRSHAQCGIREFYIHFQSSEDSSHLAAEVARCHAWVQDESDGM